MEQIAYQLGYIIAGTLTLIGLIIGFIKIITTNNKKQKRKKRTTTKKNQSESKKALIFTAIPTAIVSLVMVALFININVLGNPSESTTRARLNKVLDACTGNETSKECIGAQNKYRLYFSYCRAYFDIPEINKEIPIYAVAATKSQYVQTSSAEEMSPYYACINNLSNSIVKDTGFVELGAQASNLLAQQPHVSFDQEKCAIITNALWWNISNYKSIRNEYSAKVLGCPIHNYLIEQQTERLNEILNSYASNPIVKEYYKGFDKWNTSFNKGKCIYNKGESNERTYDSKCLTNEGDENYPLNGFPKYMKAKANTSNYISRPIIN